MSRVNESTEGKSHICDRSGSNMHYEHFCIGAKSLVSFSGPSCHFESRTRLLMDPMSVSARDSDSEQDTIDHVHGVYTLQ